MSQGACSPSLQRLEQRCDAVVLLAEADWYARPATCAPSYASRFAAALPVYFVQADREVEGYCFEPTNVPGAIILHVPRPESLDSDGRPAYVRYVARALGEAGVLRPLLWLGSDRLYEYYRRAHAPLKVRHVTDALDGARLDVCDACIYSGAGAPPVVPAAAATPALAVADDDSAFDTIVRFLAALPDPAVRSQRGNVLVLFDTGSVHVKAVLHHLVSFRYFSEHNIYYAPATGAAPLVDLADYDAVVLHSSIRVSVPDHLTSAYYESLSEYPGLKLLYVQDEYDWTNLTCQFIDELGLHVVFTCVPLDQLDKVYPRARFPRVEFLPVLTGYVPFEHDPDRPVRPLAERRYLIGYRGRQLGYWYGHLAYEKLHIGARMREICDERGLVTDIETANGRRIYGDAWFEFMEDCRATLGTESGANVFDFDRLLRQQVEEELQRNPDATYHEVHAKYLAPHEGLVVMNQISPKIFEAIIHRTALVLFEGTYSNIVRPHEHYIPLQKDFSNVDEVLAKLQDDTYLTALTERAYRDIIASGRYTYRTMVEQFDATLRAHGVSAHPPVALGPARDCLIAGAAAEQYRIVPVSDESTNGGVGLPLPPGRAA